MSKKLKGRANPLAELHFIADVPLEQAVRLVGKLADDTNAVTLTEVDTNNFKFEISSNSKINGTLQRWQGTETRIGATGDIIRTSNDLRKIQLAFLNVFAGAWGVAGLLIFLNGTLMSMLLGIVMLVMSFQLFHSVYDEFQKETPAPVYFRERDRLLQLVIDTFKAAGKVEVYDIEKKQKRLHGDTHREAYRGDATDDSDRQSAKHNRL